MTDTNTLRVAIVGSTGYGGVELIRLLQSHPRVEITSVISSSSAGAPISDGFPHLTNIVTRNLDGVNPAEIAEVADLVFAATPSGVSAKLVPELLEVGLKVIDLSGDFRLKDGGIYEQWYKHRHRARSFWKKRYTAYAKCLARRSAMWISSPIRAVIRQRPCSD